jgi:hypothetical protein
MSELCRPGTEHCQNQISIVPGRYERIVIFNLVNHSQLSEIGSTARDSDIAINHNRILITSTWAKIDRTK